MLGRMPFDLGDDAMRSRRASSLIVEARIEAPHFMRRSSHGARQQMADPHLQDAVRWQADYILDRLGFEIVVYAGIG